MSHEETIEKRTRRVGTVTIGVSMVVFGVMFLLSSVFELVSYGTVFALWPLILILLGIELLIASFFKGKLVYDKGSIFITILMMLFAAGMAAVDVGFRLADFYLDKVLCLL